MVRRKRPTPGWASATSPADADRQPAAPLDPAYRSAALTSPAAPVSPVVGRPPRVSAAARAASPVRELLTRSRNLQEWPALCRLSLKILLGMSFLIVIAGKSP